MELSSGDYQDYFGNFAVITEEVIVMGGERVMGVAPQGYTINEVTVHKHCF